MKIRPNPLLRLTAAVALACAGSAHAGDISFSSSTPLTFTDTQSYDNGTVDRIGGGTGTVVIFDSGANYTFSGNLTLTGAWNRVTLNSGAVLNVGGTLGVDVSGVSLNGGTLMTDALVLEDNPNWVGTYWDGKQTVEWGDSVINGSTIVANQSIANFIRMGNAAGYSVNWLWLNGDGATIDSNGYDIGNTMNTWGGGGLTKTGSGTLSLTASNNYTGNTNVNTGVLEVTSAGKLYGGGYIYGPVVTVASGATLRLNAWNYDASGSLGDLDFSRELLVINGGTIEYAGNSNDASNPGAAGRNFAIGTGGATIKNTTVGQTLTITDHASYGALINDNGLTVAGEGNGVIGKLISGTGALTKNGSGTWTLSGANTYSGGTTVNAGTLILDGASGGTSRIVGALTVNSGATVALTNGDTTGLGWNEGAKVTSVTINGGTVTTAGVMHVWNFSGGVKMTGGTLQSNNGVSDANGSQMEWINANVTTNASADTATIGGRIRMRADGGATGINFTVADGAAATDLLVSAAVTEASAGLGITKDGAGTMVLSGANTYSGATTVSAGTLSLTTASIDNASSVVIASGATLDLNFSGYDIVGSLDIAGSGPLPAGIYNSSTPTYGAHLTGPGSLLVLDVANGTWTSLDSGIWDDTANWSGGVIANGFDQTATFNASTGVTVTLSSAKTIGKLLFDTSDYTLAGPGTLTLDSSGVPAVDVTTGRTATIAANLGGTVGLQKTGDGTLVLTGVKSYTGGTTVTGGTLELSGANHGNGQIHGSLAVLPGATVAITGGDGSGFGWNNPVNSITVDGGTINASGTTHVGFGNFTTMSIANGSTLSGQWEWNGNGLLNFSSHGDSTNTIGGLLVLRADAGANHTFSVDDGAAATDLQVNANLADQWPEIDWVPASVLTKAGPGTMVLSGTNTYDGNTVVSNGALEVTASGSLHFRPTTNGATNSVSGSATGSLSFLGTVTLDLTAANTTPGNIWNLFNLASFTANTPVLDPAAVTSSLGSFSQASPGVWELRVTGAKWIFTAADGNLAYTVITSDYDTWGGPYGLSAGSEAGDLDNDGVTNFGEYAFGLIPNSGSSVNPITVQLDKQTGTFSYIRRLRSLTGLNYTVWYSIDLATWHEDTGAVEGTPVVNGDVESVPVTVTGSLLTNSKLFIQVRAQ